MEIENDNHRNIELQKLNDEVARVSEIIESVIGSSSLTLFRKAK